MDTAWLKSFSDTKESFTNNKKETSTRDFLTTFLKSNPINSVYNEPIDARNEMDRNEMDRNEMERNDVEPLETLSGSGFDNVKGLPTKKEEEEKEKPENTEKDDQQSLKRDSSVINEMMLTAATSLMSLYLAYNLYFNLTVGDKKMLEVEKTLDNIPMKPATNWFVEIVKNVNIFITTSIPSRVKNIIDGNPYFKYRTVFVLLVVLANFLLKPAITSVINYFKGFSLKSLKKLFRFNTKFSLKGHNIIISILFFFFLTKSLYSMFLEKSAGPIVSFIVANPILFLIGLLIYVVVLFPITVPLSTIAVACLMTFYGFFSMIYFYYMETFDAKSPYANVSSFSELLGAISNHLNFGPVVFENQNNTFEKLFAFVFNDMYYLYFFGILASMIPYIQKLQSTSLKTYFFALVGFLIAFVGALKVYGVSGIMNIFRKTI
jgi:hypothetical protein